MDGLFNPVSIMLHTLNALVLFAAIYYLLYKPVGKYMQQRAQRIAQELDDASRVKAQADDALAEGQAKRKEIFADAAAKADKMQEQAKARVDVVIADAHKEAEQIVLAANKKAEETAQNSREAMRDFAASLAVDISTKILGREVDAEDNRRLIDEFLEEVK